MAQVDLLRSLPSVDAVVGSAEVQAVAGRLDRSIMTQISRESIDHVRSVILSGASVPDPAADVVKNVCERMAKLSRPRLSEVINATGVIIHTNLGRAPVSDETAAAMTVAAGRYTPLELDIASGKRGGRMSEISEMLRLLTGAEASLVVNNNAAAVLLALSALCSGKEVILSRSQAVEIGGGFRIPDVLAQSGATLVEVGTTNRTYARDYAAAMTENTGALLTVHWSNFRIIGFTKQPLLSELSELANSRSVPLIEDLGSGSLLETTPYGLSPEPTVGESIAAGVDVVCFSGDKLLGGPQAGIVSGRADLVARVSQHPLARAVRADKTALAGIAATLRHYLRGEVLETVPVWRMISAERDHLKARCTSWLSELGMPDGIDVVQTNSAIGGGSLPGETLPSWGLAIRRDTAGELERLGFLLRTGKPAVMPRIDDDRIVLDCRTVLPDQDVVLIDRLREVIRQ